MADLFTFESTGLGPDVFRVLRFTGSEAVSECYKFDLELLALKEFDVQTLYATDASFTVTRQDGTSTAYRGRVASTVVERMKSGNYFKCRVQLVPHLWLYTLRKSSRAHVAKTIADIIDTELKENGEDAFGGFNTQFDKLPQDSFPLVIKYHETPLEFISRLLQRECLYYYFLSEGGRDILKFSSDTQLASNEVLTAKVINNLTFSSLGVDDERILSKSAHMEQMKRSESANLYTFDGNPYSVETFQGIGRTATEKSMLPTLRDISNIRTEQDSRPALRYNMATSIRGVRVGIVHDGLRALSLRHEGDQSSAVLGALGLATEPDQQDFYRNEGIWMAEGEAYVPQWTLDAPRIAYATLTGFTTGINKNGTYNIRCQSIDPATDLPNVRMMFPYAGSKGSASGMHMPLVDGTEVLLEFLEGDPDRPVILGSLYNVSVDSPVTVMNKNMHILETPAGQRMHMVDGSNKLQMEAQSRVETFSHNELLEVDSDAAFIRGHSSRLISLHAGGAKESGSDDCSGGTALTSLVLDGGLKDARIQGSDDYSVAVLTSEETIAITANTTLMNLVNSNTSITLSTTGEQDGIADSIQMVTAGKSNVIINGDEHKISLTTQDGAQVIIDGAGNKFEIITNGTAGVVAEGTKATLRDVEGGQSIELSGNATTTMNLQKTTMNLTDTEINTTKFVVNAEEIELNQKEKFFNYTKGSLCNISHGPSCNIRVAADIDFVYGLKLDSRIAAIAEVHYGSVFKCRRSDIVAVSPAKNEMSTQEYRTLWYEKALTFTKGLYATYENKTVGDSKSTAITKQVNSATEIHN